MLFLFFDTIIFMAILVGMDSGWIQRQATETKYKLRNFIKRKRGKVEDEDHSLAPLLDEDVVREQSAAAHAANNMDRGSDTAMVVNDMTKHFGDFRAVRGLSFTVKQGTLLISKGIV